jgi:pyridoxal 5'-phosphate synthase pdxT subunit
MNKIFEPLIGILDLQGDVIEHRRALEACGAKVIGIKIPEDLARVEGLVIPGGESTTISKLLKWSGLWDAIIERAKAGMPIYGTCAGAILLAKKVVGGQNVPTLELMDIGIERNSYGRQLESFTGQVKILPYFFSDSLSANDSSRDDHASLHGSSHSSQMDTSLRSCLSAVFIRAPRIKTLGQNVVPLAQYESDVVLAQEGNLLVSTFHPELTDNLTVHQKFLTLVHDARPH